GEGLEVEGEARPVGRGRVEKGVELHAVSSGFYAVVGSLLELHLLDQLRRALRERGHRAVKRGAVGRRHHLRELFRELERARGKLVIDRASSRRERQEGFARVGTVDPAGPEPAAPT